MTKTKQPETDVDRIRQRYEAERRRRLSPDAHREYLDIEDGFADLAADPYVAVEPRPPLSETIDVLIVGAGFGGLLVASKLREAQIKSIRIVDAGGDFGGTWYWNRFPGAACDIESYIYLPLLEETGYLPVERYSTAAEIRTHAQRIAKHFQLEPDAVFSTRVTSLDWDETTSRWQVRTDRGDCFRARFVVLTTGPLNRPKLPAIPGIERFAGHSFHTSRWDYTYTGGSPTAPLENLRDKRVGIIGTGATAIQCIPPLATSAKHLYVFQRTPSSVDVRGNAPTDAMWAASLEPGWQQRRIESFTHQLGLNIFEEDLVGDAWTSVPKLIREKIASGADPTDFDRLFEKADFEKMESLRGRIDSLVHDPATAEALKPWYPLFCKRPCFHDEYLQTFNGGNVTLVDTQGTGVDEITERGAVVGGHEYPLDCLIFATGFDVAGDFSKRSGFGIRGVGGTTLAEKWSQGVVTFHGMHVRGFPNCFILSPAQAGLAANFTHMLSEQAIHVAFIVRHALRDDVRTVEPSIEAEREWVETILTQGERRRRYLEACTPGYYNNEGQLSVSADQAAPYGPGPMAFFELLRLWREAGDFAGLELDGRILNSRQRKTANVHH